MTIPVSHTDSSMNANPSPHHPHERAHFEDTQKSSTTASLATVPNLVTQPPIARVTRCRNPKRKGMISCSHADLNQVVLRRSP